jgi:hypothetical protein
LLRRFAASREHRAREQLVEEMKMNRVRTLIAAAFLTIPVLSLSAATPTPADLSTSVMRESKLPTPETNACIWFLGHWICY